MPYVKKHILVISQYFYPEQFRINDMCKEWNKRGYKVTVLTGIPNYPAGKFYPGYGVNKKRHEKWEGVEIIRIPIFPRGHGKMGLVLNYLSFVVSGFFWNLFTKIKADLVFIFEVSPMTQALCGVQYAKRKKVPCYMYVQDLWPENVQIVTGINNKNIIGYIDKMVHYIYNHCHKIFATSNSFLTAIAEKVENKDTKVIYWPQYAEEFYKPKKENYIRNKCLTIIFTGNIGTAQGLDVLPGAAEILKKKKITVRFIIVGDGRNKKQLECEIEKKEVTEYFEFRGKVPPEQIPDILAEGDFAFISFMNNELFAKTIPAKLQTYLACGIPVIAAAIGETEKIIRDGQCGIQCEIGNKEKLAEILLEANCMDAEKIKIMGENAVKYCDKYFNKKKLMDKMDYYLLN